VLAELPAALTLLPWQDLGACFPGGIRGKATRPGLIGGNPRFSITGEARKSHFCGFIGDLIMKGLSQSFPFPLLPLDISSYFCPWPDRG